MPTYCSDPRVDRWSIQTLDELLLNKSHCEITPVVNLRTTNDLTENTIPEWSKDSRLNFQHMNVEMLEWQNRVHKLRFPFTNYKDLIKHGYHYCWLFYSPIVDAPKYLQAMVEEIHERSQKIQSIRPSRSGSTEEQIFQRKKFTDLQQVVTSAKDLGCEAVFNCTGVGGVDLNYSTIPRWFLDEESSFNTTEIVLDCHFWKSIQTSRMFPSPFPNRHFPQAPSHAI